MAYFGLSWPLLGLGLLFSILPDVDTPKSLPGRLFPLSSQLNSRFGHRTATHSLLFLAASLVFGPAAFLGALSHILLDLLTPSGVQLAWPKNLNFVLLGGPVKTGGRTENMLFWVLAAAALVLGLSAVTQRSPIELIQEVVQWHS